jgi:hypothetical protein
MPPAPCTGSVITAATSLPRSLINDANASMSSAGTCSTPSTKGPKSCRFGAMPCALVPP